VSSHGLKSFVLIKQVPDQSAKAGINPDGTIDRAKAKRMLNPFDRFALQAALNVKNRYGGTVTAISMGPPPAVEILLQALEHGVDECYSAVRPPSGRVRHLGHVLRAVESD
jgi:electron transfer flavoprotein beta subunit